MLRKQLTLPIAIAFASALSVGIPAQAQDMSKDEIVMKDGSRLYGTVTGARDGVISIDTGFAGTLKIEMGQVESLRSNNPAVILLEDEMVLEDSPLQISGGQVVSGTGSSYALDAVKVVNPAPWELGQGYRWTGLANAAVVLQRGNTESDELDYRLESVWRSVRDRFTFRFNGENDESNGEKTAENWQVAGKYDYFLEGPNYWGFQLLAEQDKFADLDLRLLAGPYMGRQFFSDPLFSLSGELGVSYVDEDYIVGEDKDYAAANWALNGTSNYFGGDTRLYFDQIGVWSLEETSDVIIDTTLGLAIPLVWHIEAAMEIQLDYDSGAPSGVDELDQTYRLRLGYTW
jgi:putative salt-induced outer membrane protein YdiY